MIIMELKVEPDLIFFFVLTVMMLEMLNFVSV